MDKIKELSVEELVALQETKTAELAALVAGESFSKEDVEKGEALDADLEAIAGELAEREAEAQALADRVEALRGKSAKFAEEPEAEEEEPEAKETEEVEETEEAPEAEVKEEPESKAVAARVTVKSVAAKVKKPEPPAGFQASLKITAQQDVPGFATGTPLEGMENVGEALVNRMKGFGIPTGDGTRTDLQHFGVAQFRLDHDPDLIIDRHTDEMEVLYRAADESRLSGGSLTAAGGWCAPSEVLYDFCGGETLDGILSLPEVQVKRGGFRYTRGPSYADLYTAAGFIQTEAQAIAGTTKPCFEVPCPTWQDVRLDAVGLCIKAPILTNAAYPELVQRWLSGAMIAHQHMINASVISRMVTASGAALDLTAATSKPLGSTAADTLGGLEMQAERLRQKYRLGFNQTMEVVLPRWVIGAIRSDLSNRTGQQTPVTDQQINAHFSNRGLRVTFVYDWQELPTADVGGTAGVNEALTYPTSFQAMMYPAGTFVKGVADVINLNAVYDAASLAVNIYTALFFEHAILVAQMCYESQLITLPVCNAGRTGSANLVCA